MNMIKEFDARLDTKKRMTIRGAHYDHYHGVEYSDGRILLEPRELVAPFELSVRSLAAMDASMESFKNGLVSEPIDLSAFPVTELYRMFNIRLGVPDRKSP